MALVNNFGDDLIYV